VTTALLAACVVLVVAVAVLTYELHGMPRLRRRCIVNLRGDDADSIEGVLWSRRGRWVVLKDARLLVRNEAPIPTDGEILIDRDQINFRQVL
jgi:hypothetical protein